MLNANCFNRCYGKGYSCDKAEFAAIFVENDNDNGDEDFDDFHDNKEPF